MSNLYVMEDVFLAQLINNFSDGNLMKHTHTTLKQKTFIQEYVSSGDAVESARAAGYSDRSLPSLRAEASRLKRRLSSQIAEELRINILNSVPKALGILQNLAVNAES